MNSAVPTRSDRAACSWDEERSCREGFYLDEDGTGIPYCVACGVYRITIHRQRKSSGAANYG
jgi:hypothetical protein